jgi:hypothetical protein
VFTLVMINHDSISSSFVVLVDESMSICFILLMLLLVIIFCPVWEMNGR